MESILNNFFPISNLGKKYRSYDEYFSDILKQAEMLIIYYLDCLPTYATKVDDFRISNILAGNIDNGTKNNFKNNSSTAKFDFRQAEFIISSRVDASKKDGMFFSFEYLSELLELNSIERVCIIFSLMSKYNSKYANLFACIQDDLNNDTPTYGTALKLYYFVSDLREIKDFYKQKKDLQDKLSTFCLNPGEYMKIDEGLYNFIISNARYDVDETGVDFYYPDDPVKLPVMDDIAEKIYYTYKNIMHDSTVYYYISGRDSIGKRTQVKRFSDLAEKAIIFIDLKRIKNTSQEEFDRIILMACRMSVIYKGIICVTNFDVLQNENEDNNKLIEELLSKLGQYRNTIFLLSKVKLTDRSICEGRIWVDINMRYPDKDESIILWSNCINRLTLDDKVNAFELANKFTFTPGQIVGTMRMAYKESIWNGRGSLTKKELHHCAYTQIVHNLSKKADLIYAKYDWSQLVLPDDQAHMLKNACNQIKYKHIVYDKWGMNKRIAYGKGVSMLFAGPPGTGKTMAAQVIANDLDIEIYKVDLSQIVSKYIGETEKNLNELFKEAKKTNVILFFDETDAILGKRTEVKDSHDKNANLETSYLLQKMEEYDGITVMTTNYLENIDNAFFRRISYVVHFPFPDSISRKKIWVNMFPKEMPLDPDIDFDYLANQFEIAGGNIKNTAISAAFLAAQDNTIIDMSHILKALKYELSKQGKSMLKEDFGEYAYLLKNDLSTREENLYD